MSAPNILKGSAATPLLFMMISSSDHISGLTGATVTVKIGKNGSTGAAPSGTVSQVDATNLPGLYQVAGNATDTNTFGPIFLHATATGADPTDLIVANVVAYNPLDATLGVFVQQLTESYAADGVAGTVAQMLFAIQQFQQEKNTAGTTMTIKKLDGSTTAMTFTLNSSSNPSALTRAT